MSTSEGDILDEVLALLTPEKLLHHPRATGEGVNVCVIDSGMEQSILEERARERGTPCKPIQGAIFGSTPGEPLPYEGHQSTPHGTTVADIILTIAPGVQIYSADVLGTRGSCEVEVVMRAMQHAMDVWNCSVINVSLGVAEQRLQQAQKRNKLLRVVEEAYFRDALIIAAAHNEHPFTRSYPAILSPPLLSVDKGSFEEALQFAYRLRERIEFQSRSVGYFGPFAQEPATSWAAPHLTGVVAKLLSLRPGLKPFEVKTLLYWMSSQAAHQP